MDVLNTPFNAVLEKTRQDTDSNAGAAAHFVTFDPVTREIQLSHGEDFDAAPAGQTLIYRYERDAMVVPSFREAWNQAKTEVLRAVEKRDKRFAHLG